MKTPKALLCAREARACRVQRPPCGRQVLRAEKPRGGKPQVDPERVARVEAVATGIPARVDGAEVRLLQKAPFDAAHGEILADHRGVGIVTGANVEHPDILCAELSRELRPEIDLLRGAQGAESDASAEEGVDQRFAGGLVVPWIAPAPEVEERRPIEEEVPPLREKEREAGQVGLPLIDLGLGKVGVHREHGAGAGRRVVEEVDSHVAVAIERSGVPSRDRTARRCLGGYEPVRLDVDAESLADVADSGDVAGIRHALQALVARPAHPDARFVLALNRPFEVHPPRIALGVEVDGAERELDLDRPADLTAVHADRPDPVPRPVLAARSHQRVGHVSEWIGLEEVAAAGVEEGVDGPPNLVVGGQALVPPALIGDPLVGLGVVRGHAEIQRVAIVGDAHFGFLGGRGPVVRVYLDEVAGGHGALPHRLVEAPVHRHAFVGLDARGRNGSPFPVAVDWPLLTGLGARRAAEDEGEQTRKPGDFAWRNHHEARLSLGDRGW